jgi:hypothetical protein
LNFYGGRIMDAAVMHSDDTIKTDSPATRGAFFGRRKGKKLRQHQSTLFESLLPRLSVDLDRPAPEPICSVTRWIRCGWKSASAGLST